MSYCLICLKTATSLKVLLDNWNVQTALWLRRICYERAPPKLKMGLTYMLSAFWHGFYPGYYFCFIGAIPFTALARQVSAFTHASKSLSEMLL